MSFFPEALASAPSFRVLFAEREEIPTDGPGLTVGVPCLGGDAHELILGPVAPEIGKRGLQVFRAQDTLVGFMKERAGPDLAAQAERLYARALEAVGGRHLYRVWNYVPRINDDVAGLEQYRAFCKGRSVAFEKAFGAEFQRRLPAASAVGTEAADLAIVFVAWDAAPRHIENPEQVPAYHYPMEYGPRAPSFSRATLVSHGRRDWTYISGTAAIKGHATVAPGSLHEQIACTLDNLRLISRACGLGEQLGGDGGWTRHFKVYLRHAEDYVPARKALRGALIAPGDSVSYLRADVCRAALNVEIEATLSRRP